MNAFSKQAFAAVLLAGVIAAPASASVQRDVQQAIGSEGRVSVSVNDGVATLFGYTDGLSKHAAERAALASADVDRVINLVTTN